MHIQIIGLHGETRALQMDVNQVIIASLTQEAKLSDLKSCIIALLLQAQDIDVTDKYTFGLVTAWLDGRNAKDVSDPDPRQFALMVLDDFTDDQKVAIINEKMKKYSWLSDSDKVRVFDTEKVGDDIK